MATTTMPPPEWLCPRPGYTRARNSYTVGTGDPTFRIKSPGWPDTDYPDGPYQCIWRICVMS